jgi:hypothetical protein
MGCRSGGLCRMRVAGIGRCSGGGSAGSRRCRARRAGAVRHPLPPPPQPTITAVARESADSPRAAPRSRRSRRALRKAVVTAASSSIPGWPLPTAEQIGHLRSQLAGLAHTIDGGEGVVVGDQFAPRAHEQPLRLTPRPKPQHPDPRSAAPSTNQDNTTLQQARRAGMIRYDGGPGSNRVQPGTRAARFTSRHFGCRGGRRNSSNRRVKACTKRATLR